MRCPTECARGGTLRHLLILLAAYAHPRPAKQWCGAFVWGKIDIVRANAFMYYIPGSLSHQPFMRLKYQRRRPQMGHFFGRLMAEDLADTDFFSAIDLIIPIPLSAQWLRQRGYNQST